MTNEAKNSTIISSKYLGVWENEYGVDIGNGKKGFFQYEYDMQDGLKIKANHKENHALTGPCGYEVKGSNNYGSWGKVGKPQEEQYTGQQAPQSKPSFDDRNRGVALSYAKDLYIGEGQPLDKLNDILFLADKFYQWLDNKPEEVQAPQVQQRPAQGELPPQPQADAFQPNVDQHSNAPDWMQ